MHRVGGARGVDVTVPGAGVRARGASPGGAMSHFCIFILAFLIAERPYSLFCAFSSLASGAAGCVGTWGGARGRSTRGWRNEGEPRRALFFSAGLLRQMSHSHVPIKNNRCCAIIFCAFTYLIIVESWCDTDVSAALSATLATQLT